MSREVTAKYTDPLDLIWLETARSLGLTVTRTEHAYASTNGRGTLSLSAQVSMDADDCLAQMILHEICHWLVQGSASVGWVDWGLDNEGDRDVEREHACLRLQAALLDPFGLRQALAPTTDFRNYYNQLPTDPFEERSPSERESITRARAAHARRTEHPFRNHVDRALQATTTILRATQEFLPATPPSLLSETGSSTELASQVTVPLPRHRVGLPMYFAPSDRCGTCAWFVPKAAKPAVGQCRQAKGRTTSSDSPSCTHYEQIFDCLSCGACCREAYDAVEVRRGDPALKKHGSLLVSRPGGGHDLARDGNRCCCLRGGLDLNPAPPSISGGNAPSDAGHRLPPLIMPNETPFTCDIYETRPTTCRAFTIFSANCLFARRRVGLSR